MSSTMFLTTHSAFGVWIFFKKNSPLCATTANVLENNRNIQNKTWHYALAHIKNGWKNNSKTLNNLHSRWLCLVWFCCFLRCLSLSFRHHHHHIFSAGSLIRPLICICIHTCSCTWRINVFICFDNQTQNDHRFEMRLLLYNFSSCKSYLFHLFRKIKYD